MKVAVVLAMASMIPMTSCIGSFSLTSKVLDWNRTVTGDKFVNELAFIALCVLPVYEITMVADAVIFNTIEFWSGNNPIQGVKLAHNDSHIRIEQDAHGYSILNKETGAVTRLDFNEKTQTWSVVSEGKAYPFMTMVDDSHVRMIGADGNFQTINLNEAGVMAYRNAMESATLQAAR